MQLQQPEKRAGDCASLAEKKQRAFVSTFGRQKMGDKTSIYSRSFFGRAVKHILAM